ncbi:endonuclease [Sphingomonas sp. So64.6b]|uniref:endonuclease III domain-containing protein n=1 Tax=Sphingomonas sp. So64.6b TaxID=2997354 RepID=UPI0015FED0F9|nr:endonuclease [Sphingomonas sp. So64.6b]QNA85944.1 endonuclease [Sphingomonas sp. So64.6b]
MQSLFDFAARDIERWRESLMPVLADIEPLPHRKPIGQLVKSLISGRTRDPVSLAAYRRLRARFGSARGIAMADPSGIEAVISDVTFAQEKAAWLVAALRTIGRERPDYTLDFLAGRSLEAALAWLERLPGVGRKVAAATLNASTLRMPVLIVDGHVLRVLVRLSFVTPRSDARATSEAVTAAMPDWDADDFLTLHMLLKRLGQVACRPDTPDCDACPLRHDCPSARN